MRSIHPWNFITLARVVLEICSGQRTGRRPPARTPARPPARHGWSHNTSRLRRAYKKEKLLIMINFSFSHSVFQRFLLQTRKNQGLFGKGLRLFQIESISRRRFKLKFCLWKAWKREKGENIHFISIFSFFLHNIFRGIFFVKVFNTWDYFLKV